jgi:hypothetical protein
MIVINSFLLILFLVGVGLAGFGAWGLWKFYHGAENLSVASVPGALPGNCPRCGNVWNAGEWICPHCSYKLK